MSFPSFGPPQVRSKNPLEVWGAFENCLIGICGPPGYIQTGEGGEWKSEGVKLSFQGIGAHLWISERRNGLARGIYNRFA